MAPEKLDHEDVAKNEKEDVAFRRLVEETAKECGVRFGSGALSTCQNRGSSENGSRRNQEACLPGS